MASVTDDEFKEEFSTFGVSVDDSSLFEQLRHLCEVYRLDAEKIVCEWLAFAQNKNNIKLSKDAIEHMERERLAKKGNRPIKKNVSGTPSRSYNINTVGQAVAEDMLDAYSTPNSKGMKKRQITPDQSNNKRLANLNAAGFSPASFSPAQRVTPTAHTYRTRSNAGTVVSSWGTTENMSWKSQRNEPVEVKPYESTSALTSRFKHMFQKLSDKALVLNEMIEEMGDFLKSQRNIEEFSHVALPSQDSCSVVGRVCCDTVGHLNAKSVILEGSRETSAGKTIPIDLSQVQQFSLFPAQICAMDGINSTGNKFVVQKIHEAEAQPLVASGLSSPLSVVVAAGPFTTSDSFMYEPLSDLVKYLLKEAPDVCILLGPFVDAKQPDLEKTVTDTFEDFFRTNIVETLLNATERLQTQLVLVPSYRDVHHEYVYPQPPFSINKGTEKRVHTVSDPCTLNIDGVVIGVTSTDILFHLGAEETSGSVGGDRLSRLTNHILTQHNYYPLYPGHEDVCIDYDYFDLHGRMPCTPHVLVLPSDLRYFIKDVQGCVCVNPGRLAKGQVGGTFARLIIQPLEDSPNTNSLASVTSGQVMRI